MHRSDRSRHLATLGSRFRASREKAMSMKHSIPAALAIAALCPSCSRGQDARRGQGARPAGVRRQHLGAGLLQRRQPGSLDRPGRRLLPRRCRRGAERREQGEVRAAELAAALHVAAGGRDRRPVAQQHLDADAGCFPRRRVRRHQLLRRPGLHGADEAEDRQRQEAERSDRLRAGRHDEREERRRLLRRQRR